jgi:hypothetical protein
MTKSTTNGDLNYIDDCYIDIPGATTVRMKSLPDISDSKQAVYNGENIMGRSFPLYTYSHSADRAISIQLHFFIVTDKDASKNIEMLRAIQSAVYPRRGSGGAPYMPPPICTIKCGKLIDKDPICAVLQSYSLRFPTEVAWYEKDDGKYCPYRFDVDTSWSVVYTSSELPFQDRIYQVG